MQICQQYRITIIEMPKMEIQEIPDPDLGKNIYKDPDPVKLFSNFLLTKMNAKEFFYCFIMI